MENPWNSINNCEVTLYLNCSQNCVICKADRATKFGMTNAKRYVPGVTFSTQDNAKLLQHFNQVLKEQLIGINIDQNDQQKPKIDFYIS